MNTEDVKIGETYYIPAKVIGINEYGNPKVCVLNHDMYCFPCELRPIPTPEPPTLHDPCRKFRNGDNVEVVANKGRKNICSHGDVGTVTKDEDEMGQVTLKLEHTGVMVIDAAYLKLITPVEEMEPYCVVGNQKSKSVEVRRRNPERVVASFYWGGEAPAYTQEEARKAAEAECARLNEEWRKEQQ